VINWTVLYYVGKNPRDNLLVLLGEGFDPASVSNGNRVTYGAICSTLRYYFTTFEMKWCSPTVCDVTLALLTEFADKPADVLLLRLPILWGVTLALLTEFADKPLVACAPT